MGIQVGQRDPTKPFTTVGFNTPSAAGIFTAKNLINDALTISCSGYASVLVSTLKTGSVAGGTFVFEASDDGGGTWWAIYALYVNNLGAAQQIPTASAAITNNAAYLIPVVGFTQFRVRCSVAPTGTGSTLIRVQASTAAAGAVSLLGSIPAGTNVIGGVNVSQFAGQAFSATNIVLQASQVSAIANGTTTRTITTGLGIYKTLDILISITAGGTATGTLQLFLEDSADGGTTFDDLCSSLTFTFGAAVTTQRFFVNGYSAPGLLTGSAAVANLTQGGVAAVETLAAGSARQGPWGDRIRVREVVSAVAGSPVGPSYTINCVAKP